MLLVEGTPVPERVIDCKLLLAVSLIVRVALRTPVVVGLKRIVRLQLASGARIVPQVLAEITKSFGLIPPTTILLMVIDEAPLFVKVADFGPLVLPNGTTAQTRLDGLIDAAAPQVSTETRAHVAKTPNIRTIRIPTGHFEVGAKEEGETTVNGTTRNFMGRFLLCGENTVRMLIRGWFASQ